MPHLLSTTVLLAEVRELTPLHQWIEAGESQTQEFKSSFDKACIETLVAFANAKGGRVLVGVSDQGGVQGVTLGKEMIRTRTWSSSLGAAGASAGKADSISTPAMKRFNSIQMDTTTRKEIYATTSLRIRRFVCSLKLQGLPFEGR